MRTNNHLNHLTRTIQTALQEAEAYRLAGLFVPARDSWHWLSDFNRNSLLCETHHECIRRSVPPLRQPAVA
jgi:hypothetical protein